MPDEALATDIADLAWKNHHTNVLLEGLTESWSKLPESKIHSLIQGAHDAIRGNEARVKDMLKAHSSGPLHYNQKVIDLLGQIEEIALQSRKNGAVLDLENKEDEVAQTQLDKVLKEYINSRKSASLGSTGHSNADIHSSTSSGSETRNTREEPREENTLKYQTQAQGLSSTNQDSAGTDYNMNINNMNMDIREPYPKTSSNTASLSSGEASKPRTTKPEPLHYDELRSIPSLSPDSFDRHSGFEDDVSPLKTSHETKKLKERLNSVEERNRQLELELAQLRSARSETKSDDRVLRFDNVNMAPKQQQEDTASSLVDQYLVTGRGLIKPRDLVRVWSYQSDKLKNDRQNLRSEVAFLRLQAYGYQAYIKLMEEVLDIVEILPKKPPQKTKPTMKSVVLMVYSLIQIQQSARKSRRNKEFHEGLFRRDIDFE